MIMQELISSGSKTLKQNQISTYILDSELILSNILNESRENIDDESMNSIDIDNVSVDDSNVIL